MEIRPLAMTDLPVLLEFYMNLSAQVISTYQPFGPTVTEAALRDHLANTESGVHISLGLFDETGSICGHTFILAVNSAAPVFGIGLDERVIGKGLGRLMASRVLAAADAQGLELVTLTVVKTNTRAWKLYESLGFQRSGETTFLQPNESFCMEKYHSKLAL
jgi:RimJ/RimL family protein N-acetyltransferase